MASFVNHGLLRVARQALGLSQGEAAAKLDIPQVTLSRYENAISIPNDEFLARAALVYDLPISFFEQTDAVLGAVIE